MQLFINNIVHKVDYLIIKTHNMKKFKLFSIILVFLFFSLSVFSQGFIIDHNCTKLDSIPESAINLAKQNLHIAYGHTSHGSQLITGMTGLDGQTDLVGYKGDIYKWNEGGTSGALDIDDYFGSGDLGHNGDTTWAPVTRTYLASHTDVNVVMYSWCGGVSDNTTAGIQIYLDKMNELEQDFPNVTFVYMTGHSESYADAKTKANNKQIRDYCKANNKILYDFFDIESYNPDGTYFEFVDDDCRYFNEAGGASQGNWAEEWRDAHTENIDWYNCSSAHSDALNANQKAYAAWWMWAMIAGWEGTTNIKNIDMENNISISPNPASNTININTKLKITDLTIINSNGQIVKTIQNNNKTIDISDLETGIYILKINNAFTTKFIKE